MSVVFFHHSPQRISRLFKIAVKRKNLSKVEDRQRMGTLERSGGIVMNCTSNPIFRKRPGMEAEPDSSFIPIPENQLRDRGG
jgi:hypothetical protein